MKEFSVYAVYERGGPPIPGCQPEWGGTTLVGVFAAQSSTAALYEAAGRVVAQGQIVTKLWAVEEA